jgi:Na+/H+ antiporter NhaD/arsenite permease-like protein
MSAGLDPLFVAPAVLGVTYGAVMSEKVNRAVAALIGAGAMIVLGVLDQQRAIRAIDFNTIALLTGMMLIVAVTRRSGVFQYVALWAARRVKASPAGLLVAAQVVTATFSALLDNVTTVLLMTRVVLVIAEELEVSPWPFLIGLILSANIGGIATLVGDPPNILIGSAAGLGFDDFVIALGPIVVAMQAAVILALHLVWGRRLAAPAAARARVMGYDPAEAILNRRLLYLSLAVIGMVVAAFALARPLGLAPGTIALSGAAVLMLLDGAARPAGDRADLAHATFAEIDWVTIFFFVGLFVVVGGVERTGLLGALARSLAGATGGGLAPTALTVLVGAAGLSAVIDNIPFVAAMVPVIKSLGPQFGGAAALTPLWWALSLGACLGGNGTLIGASANLTVAGLAERAGHPVRFWPFLKIALPLTVMTLAIAGLGLWIGFLRS